MNILEKQTHFLHDALTISDFYKVRLNHVTVVGFRRWGVGFVPGRNAFLLHTALMAVTFQKGMVAIGIHSGTAYRDCSEDRKSTRLKSSHLLFSYVVFCLKI